MYEFITKDDWEFNVDIEKTKEYYRTYSDLCDCNLCKNFYQTIKDYSSELSAFLEQFGIDVKKPIEIEWNILDKQSKTLDYTAYYAVHGTAVKGRGYEIDFGSINVIIQYQDNSPNTSILEPYFVFQIFNLFPQWVLSENIEPTDTSSKKKWNNKKQKLNVPDDCMNYNHIGTLVFSKLASILDVNILKKATQHGYYIIDSVNDLCFEFGGSEVLICYLKEHHHIMGMDFKTMDEWASEVVNYLRLFINRTVRFEYYFKGDKQIRIKLYSLCDGNEELIEHIRMTLNPILLNSKNSRKEIKLIEFKQQ